MPLTGPVRPFFSAQRLELGRICSLCRGRTDGHTNPAPIYLRSPSVGSWDPTAVGQCQCDTWAPWWVGLGDRNPSLLESLEGC